MAGELILIIEDNEKNMKLVRDVLQFNGYKTAEATTAEDGLVLARSQHPALILLDIQLPGMDGFAALRQLRADPITKRTPVIAVTASVMERDRQKILEAGFDGYMTKPIHIKEFAEEIRRVLATE
jgi:two-component system cell cycle response regulator DivK